MGYRHRICWRGVSSEDSLLHSSLRGSLVNFSAAQQGNGKSAAGFNLASQQHHSTHTRGPTVAAAAAAVALTSWITPANFEASPGICCRELAASSACNTCFVRRNFCQRLLVAVQPGSVH